MQKINKLIYVNLIVVCLSSLFISAKNVKIPIQAKRICGKILKTDDMNYCLVNMAFLGREKEVEELIKLGVDINVMDEFSIDDRLYRGTPLIGAIKGCHNDLAKRLIELGADFKSPIIWSEERNLIQYPICFALEGCHIKYEIGKGPCLYNDKVISKRIEIVEYMLKSGADPNIHCMGGYPPIFSALNDRACGSCRDKDYIKKLIKLLKIMIENGADVNMRSKENLTPLMFLLKVGCWVRYEQVKILLEAGARADLKYPDGKRIIDVCYEKIGESTQERICNLIERHLKNRKEPYSNE